MISQISMYLVTCYKMHMWLCCVAGVVIVALSCRQVWCRTVGFSRAVHHFSFAHGTEQETCLTQLSCLSPLSFHNKGSSFTVFGKSLPVLFVSIRFESEWGEKSIIWGMSTWNGMNIFPICDLDRCDLNHLKEKYYMHYIPEAVKELNPSSKPAVRDFEHPLFCLLELHCWASQRPEMNCKPSEGCSSIGSRSFLDDGHWKSINWSQNKEKKSKINQSSSLSCFYLFDKTNESRV